MARDNRTHYRRLGRGIGDQIGLACTVSPAAGSRRLALARAWCVDLPARYGLLRAGQVSEWVATVVARETSHLDGPTRRLVDAQLAGRSLQSKCRRPGRPAGPRAGWPTPWTRRRWWRGPGPRKASGGSRSARPRDSMAILTAYLPAAQGIAAWVALRRAADTQTAAGDPRTRGQVMADTLVERLTASGLRPM